MITTGDQVALTPELDAEPYEFSHARRKGKVTAITEYKIGQRYPDDPRLTFYEATKIATVVTPTGKLEYYNADWLIKL